MKVMVKTIDTLLKTRLTEALATVIYYSGTIRQ